MQVKQDIGIVRRVKLKQQRPVFRMKVEYTKGVTRDRSPGISGRYGEGYEFDR